MSLIIRAAQFAAEKHAGQKRKYSGAPFISHPLRVAGLVAILLDAEDSHVAVGWLHDVAEDCAVPLYEIRKRFGEDVSCGLYWLTSPSRKYPERTRVERKQMDREHIACASEMWCCIKAIDRIDNLNELPASESFCELYAHESRQLAEVLESKITAALRQELNEAILRLEVTRRHYLAMASQRRDMQVIDGETA